MLDKNDPGLIGPIALKEACHEEKEKDGAQG